MSLICEHCLSGNIAFSTNEYGDDQYVCTDCLTVYDYQPHGKTIENIVNRLIALHERMVNSSRHDDYENDTIRETISDLKKLYM